MVGPRRLIRRFFPDRHFRLARKWSNKQLRQIAGKFSGNVVNVSAWRDEDKEGNRYQSYFSACSSYSITNFDPDKCGFQNREGEIFLDLEKPLQAELIGKFDVVFNHTTLEHVYDFRTAFGNICLLSRDVVIVVVPWLQVQHADYGDYWRFSPLALARLFDENGFTVARLTWNSQPRSSVYLFAVGVRDKEKWQHLFEFNVDPFHTRVPDNAPGRSALSHNWWLPQR